MADDPSTRERWARFRFAVIGPLLACPPRYGQLRPALQELSRRTFVHPVSGQPTRFALSTLERWYYTALRHDDPVGELERKVRKDAGHKRRVTPALAQAIRKQYAEHPRWSYQLHYDNLLALSEMDPSLPVPSYPTVRRYMKSQGLLRQRRKPDHRIQHGPREVRSYELPYAHALWHYDFHQGSRNVLRAEGRYETPRLLAILDDHSRIGCHAQWYLEEGAEQLVHGLQQAFMKHELPRSAMSDNGSAMVAAETRQGLLRLGIHQDFTLPESPYQNGKGEAFFAQVEGRLMAMLEGVRHLDLDTLNRATLAWLEGEYNRRVHDELGVCPLDRLRGATSVGRSCPSVQVLKDAFRQQVSRKQRRGDGTCSIEGVRFEIPAHYRHIERIHVRYARWDLGHVTMVDPVKGTALAPLYPLDKARNANRHRRPIAPGQRLPEPPAETGIAPHLAKLMADYAATGLPPAYLPPQTKDNPDDR